MTADPRAKPAGAIALPARSERLQLRRSQLLGLIAVAAIVAVAAVGPLAWRHGPLTQNVGVRLQNPSWTYPLGTDRFGRDILARLLMGARWSLAGAFLVCAGTNAVGVLVAALAASGNRFVDGAIGRLVESLMALPGLVAALALTAVLGPSFTDLLIALVVTGWPGYARIYRSLFLKERTALYVEGAAAVGAGPGRILLRHVLPNAAGQVVILASANFGYALLNLAALSFLGLGMQPPTPEWGRMVNDARAYFERLPWQMIAPGLCIACSVVAANLGGDALRDALDPRSRGRRR